MFGFWISFFSLLMGLAGRTSYDSKLTQFSTWTNRCKIVPSPPHGTKQNKRSQKQDSNRHCTAASWKYEWKSLWRWCVEAQSRFVVHVETCLRFANTCSFVATSRGCAILVWPLFLWPSVFWRLLVLMAEFVVTCSGDHCASFETQLVRSTSSVN